MKQSNLKIAITGGIGSGKSTVAGIIRNMGFAVVSCDEIYKNLLCEENFLSKLAAAFGDILTENGELDRKKLSLIVFTDEVKLKKLNEITHPAIMKEALNRMQGEEIYFCEVPLLFEGGYESLFDGVIVVLRDEEERIKSVAQRDSLSVSEVRNRLINQFEYKNLRFEKYYVIHNDSDMNELYNKTLKIIEKINK